MIEKDKDILYYFEKGELQTIDGKHADATVTWRKADEVVREWEDRIKTDPSKLAGDVGSYLINDKTRRYEGQYYEKVMLRANLAMSSMMQGKYDDARVAMQKTYELETEIKNIREKEYDKLQEDEKNQKVSTTVKDMKGYPMAELDAPEVTSLKNGYQNAFAHYLSGFFFSVRGEHSLAEAGYRLTSELSPGSKYARDALEGVYRRRVGPNESDVLFVVESGFAPSWKSITIPIPIPRGRGGLGLIATPLSFPLIKSENKGFVPPAINVAKQKVPVETLSNLDAMARRHLRDEMPGILLRTVIRAVVKSVAQEQANKAGLVAGLAATAVSVVSEQADDRSWRTLPEKISIARATLPQGKHTIEFQTEFGVHRTEVEIGDRFSIIPIRISGGAVFVGQPAIQGNMPEIVAQPEQATKAQPTKRQPVKRPATKKAE